MGLPPSIALQALGGLLRNVLTGYNEPPTQTNEERTAIRRDNQTASCNRLLMSAVGAGDLLDSETRAEIAKEAYICGNCCSGCRSMKFTCLPPTADFAEMNQKTIEHDYATEGPFRDVVHGIVNMQDKLDEAFFENVVERMKAHHKKKVEKSDGTKDQRESMDAFGDNDDKFRAMAIELCVVAASCAGVKAFYKTAGIESPLLPTPPNPPTPARFKKVSDYSTGPLATDKGTAWGPYLPVKQLRKQVARQHEMDMAVYSFAGNPTGPTSKASSVPTTCMEWMRFMCVMYVSPQNAPTFFSAPGHDRHLTRGQLEVAAAAYNGAVSCRF